MSTETTPSGFWSEYYPPNGGGPDTGLKLHVSASVRSAADVLSRVLPILAEMQIPFKHAANTQGLLELSTGQGGITQVGKCITAYPPDSETASALATLLHGATKGLSGPRIRSERAYAEASLVHYRYGAFSRRWLQLYTGRIVPARLDQDGALEIDDRLPSDRSASLQTTIMEDDGPPQRPDRHVLRDTYFRVERLYATCKGSTWLGYSTESRPDCLLIIKEAYALVMEGDDGLDASQRLENEAECLRKLASTGAVPVFIDFWREPGSAVLV